MTSSWFAWLFLEFLWKSEDMTDWPEEIQWMTADRCSCWMASSGGIPSLLLCGCSLCRTTPAQIRLTNWVGFFAIRTQKGPETLMRAESQWTVPSSCGYFYRYVLMYVVVGVCFPVQVLSRKWRTVHVKDQITTKKEQCSIRSISETHGDVYEFVVLFRCPLIVHDAVVFRDEFVLLAARGARHFAHGSVDGHLAPRSGQRRPVHVHHSKLQEICWVWERNMLFLETSLLMFSQKGISWTELNGWRLWYVRVSSEFVLWKQSATKGAENKFFFLVNHCGWRIMYVHRRPSAGRVWTCGIRRPAVWDARRCCRRQWWRCPWRAATGTSRTRSPPRTARGSQSSFRRSLPQALPWKTWNLALLGTAKYQRFFCESFCKKVCDKVLESLRSLHDWYTLTYLVSFWTTGHW